MSCGSGSQLNDIDLGSTVRLEAILRIDGEIITDPGATVTVTVLKPDRTTTTPTVSSPSTGTYAATVIPDAPGQWWYRFESEDPRAAEEGSFIVRRSQFP